MRAGEEKSDPNHARDTKTDGRQECIAVRDIEGEKGMNREQEGKCGLRMAK